MALDIEEEMLLKEVDRETLLNKEALLDKGTVLDSSLLGEC